MGVMPGRQREEKKDIPPVNPLDKKPGVPDQGIDDLLDGIDDSIKQAEKKDIQKRDEKKGQ